MDDGPFDAIVVLTDLVGSTALARALGDQWPAVLVRHDSIVADACTSRGGRLAGSTGDGRSYVFTDANAAVAAAWAVTTGVQAEQWPGPAEVRVRVGVHRGPVYEAAGGFQGVTIHEAARITAVTGSGRVVVSDRARGAVDALPPGTSLIDLGRHRVRDMLELVRLHGLEGEDVPAGLAFSQDDERLTPTPMLGRAGELAALRAALAGTRLVTVVGPGGIGKTRLAAELARTHPGDAVIVDLTRVESDEQVAPLMRDLLLGGGRGSGVEAELSALVGTRSLLIVLDNCEHVLHGARAVCGDLLDRCPRVGLLATCRQALEVEGERPWILDGLDEDGGIELFLARSALAVGSKRSAGLDRSVVAEVCRRLDFVPLAIELAAARLRILDLAALLARTNDQMRLLVDRHRAGPERQRTMNATIATSVANLDPAASGAFAALSVFRGGALLDALLAVVEPTDDFDLLDAVEDLVVRSLVVRDDTTYGQSRYRQLEPIRQFARGMLDDDTWAALRDRHAWWLQHFVRSTAPEMLSRPGVRALLADEVANVADAVEHLVAVGDTHTALRLVAGLDYFWFSERPAEGWRLTSRVLDACTGDEPPHSRAGGLLAAGPLLAQQLRIDDSRKALSEAVELFGDRRSAGLGWALFQLGRTEASAHDPHRARELFGQAARVFAEINDAHGELWARFLLAQVCDDEMERRHLVRVAIQVARRAQLSHVLASMLIDAAMDAFKLDTPEVALGHIDEAIEIFEHLGDAWQLTDTCISGASLCLSFDRPEASHYLGKAAARVTSDADETHRRHFVGIAAEWLRRRGDTTSAAELAGALDDRWRPRYSDFGDWMAQCLNEAPDRIASLTLDDAVERAVAYVAGP